MHTGAITSYIDVAQLALYAFWIFFAGLIFYLRSEDKREGYPLQSDHSRERTPLVGFPGMPKPKAFLLRDGSVVMAPRQEAPSGPGNASPTGSWPGAPLEPDGDPMQDGVGPAAYAMRADVPDLTVEDTNRLAPLRVAVDYFLDPEDPDPRGMVVVGNDGAVGGVVTDLWVDRAEMVLRYLEVGVSSPAGETRHVLLPMNLARVSGSRRQVKAASVLGRHFATAPGLRHPDEVTLREEDRLTAYFASGYMYATPARAEPIL